MELRVGRDRAAWHWRLELRAGSARLKNVEPIYNLDDPVGKTVGRRKAPADSLCYALGLQKTLNRMAPLRVPRGVFRFRSHEEADAWLMDHLTRRRES
jgi:hypothetical protein